MDRIVVFDSQKNDITCMKVFDALANPCEECDNIDCEEKQENVQNI